jgi:5'-phosphate synthase pdxT subunit
MTPGPAVGVLGLQGDVREHVATISDLGVDVQNVRTPAELERVDALVLPGGESTTLGMLLVSSGLDGPLRKRLQAGMPAFGTCAGMILLATSVLDGRADQHPLQAIDITVRRNAFGRQVESFEADLEVTGLDSAVHSVFIRAPIVEAYGEGVEVLAEVEYRGERRPVVCRERNVFVASFHPELTGDTRLHGLFLDCVRDSL